MFQDLFGSFFNVYATLYREKLSAVQNRDDRALKLINAKLQVLHLILADVDNLLLYEHEMRVMDEVLAKFTRGDE